MSYARSRLLLGMLGVGLLVLTSFYCLIKQVPLKWLPVTEVWSGSDLIALVTVIGGLITTLLPLDLLGGYLLPNRAGPKPILWRRFVIGWVRGVGFQGCFFLLASLLILALGRWQGLLAVSCGIIVLGFLLIAFQLKLGSLIGGFQQVTGLSTSDRDRMDAATRQTVAWGWKPRDLILLTHQDPGFTGGVVGIPGFEKVVVPDTALLRLSSDELAATLARRLEAIEDGSRARGILVAVFWVVLGFNLSSFLPGAGVTSVGGLAMTCLGFTLWTFIGLLTLPTLSRQASFAIDKRVLGRGVAPESLHRSVRKFDELQDDEPERPAVIEAIFHPVPSVIRRQGQTGTGPPLAWHVARMTLFLSWACMGILVRAVHCNVGRPELWVMYPSD